MVDAKVRINRISLTNFKSVGHGSIDFKVSDSLHQEEANITGIYGQNGSGKTVVVEAIDIIKHLLSGKRIPNRYLDIIAQGKDSCSLEVEFLIIDEGEEAEKSVDCTAIYSCALEYREDRNEVTFDGAMERPRKFIAVVSERLRIRGSIYGSDYILHDIAKTDENSNTLITPLAKRDELFGKDKNTLNLLKEQKILALYRSRSFIFSKQVRKIMFEFCKTWHFVMILALALYSNSKLVVIENQPQDNYNFHHLVYLENLSLPIILHFNENGKGFLTDIRLKAFQVMLDSLNIVLSSIVPGLTISFKQENITSDNGEAGYMLELLSNREDLGIFPFKNESLGIKKIASFLSCLISAYNNPSITLVVDEMDASVFEHLFGTLLDVMNNSGKGQLIFTSHNLRPLEVLDSPSVIFTTTEPMNRYTRMTKKATNNLRDMYLRTILLGHEDKELYNGDSQNTIAYSFRKAGRVLDNHA